MTRDLRTLPPAPAGRSVGKGLPVRVPDWFPRPRLAAQRPRAEAAGLPPGLVAHALAPTAGVGFDGLQGGDPPDDNGAVGPRYYVQTINSSIAFYDKGTGAPVSSASLASFFAAGSTGTSCDTEQRSDPVALYDAAADRYIVTDLSRVDENFGPWYECVAISRTSDPIAGGWYFYAVGSGNAGAGELANRWLNDYPKLGVWPDGYYMMADMFDTVACPGGAGCKPGDTVHSFFTTVRVWALDRATMLTGGAMSAITFDVPSVFSMVPTNWTGAGTAPPAGRVNYFGVTDYPDPSKGQTSTTIHIYKFHADWGTPSNSTFTGPSNVTVPSYTSPSVAPPQPGTNNLLDTLGTRLMYQFQYRNIGGTESLWGTHAIDQSGFNAVRWYQFDVTGDPATPALVQSGETTNSDSTHRWMGHLASDRFGNMAIEYSDSSSTVNPGVRYTGRLSGDAAGTLQAEATLFTGPGVFQDCAPGTGQTTCVARWGDYSSMQVDPVDDCTFWFTNEYAAANGASSTRWGSARFGGCTCNVQIVKSHSPTPVLANGVLTWQLHVTNGGPVGAYAVTVADNLADRLAAPVTPPAGWSCSAPPVGSAGVLTCTGVLPSGGAADIFVSVTAPDSLTPAANTATVTTGSANTAPLANTTATDSAAIISPANVTGTKTVATPAAALVPGFPVTYEVVLSNSSNNDQFDNPGDEFTDTLPSTLVLNGATATSGTATTSGNTVHWNGAVPAHSSVTITIHATIVPSATPGSTITNTGTIYYDITGTGTNSATNTVTASFAIPLPIPTLTLAGLTILFLAVLGLGALAVMRRT